MIKWNIVSVDTAKVGEHLDAVIMARWVCKATEGDKTAVQLGATALGAPSENFIPYDELTEEAVLEFCFNNGLNKLAVEAKTTADLQAALSAPDSPPLPWSKASDLGL